MIKTSKRGRSIRTSPSNMIPVTEFITTIPNTCSIKIRMRMRTGRGARSTQEERTVRGANLELVSHAIKIPSKEILNRTIELMIIMPFLVKEKAIIEPSPTHAKLVLQMWHIIVTWTPKVKTKKRILNSPNPRLDNSPAFVLKPLFQQS